MRRPTRVVFLSYMHVWWLWSVRRGEREAVLRVRKSGEKRRVVRRGRRVRTPRADVALANAAADANTRTSHIMHHHRACRCLPRVAIDRIFIADCKGLVVFELRPGLAPLAPRRRREAGKPAMDAPRQTDRTKTRKLLAKRRPPRIKPRRRLIPPRTAGRRIHFLLTASNGAFSNGRRASSITITCDYAASSRQRYGWLHTLVTTPGAKPDDLMNEIRTVVVEELNEQQTMGFVVLNRPNSVLKALESGKLQFEEEYVLVAETDHLLLKVLKNTATRDVALGYPFHYMNPTRDANTRNLVRRFAGSDDVAARVQQVGPSPILVHMEALRKLVKPWYDLSFALKRDAAADAEFGWMLEMWGYSIGAAVAGVKHELLNELQLEPSSQFGLQITSGGTGGWTNALGGGGKGEPTHHILHYTFSHEYSLEGIPMIDSRAGQWALDKKRVSEGLA